jgi:DNA-binding beta-propeller fold protein YncE
VVAIVVDKSGSGGSGGDVASPPELSSMAVSPDGQYLYLATAQPPRVSMISTATWQTVARRGLHAQLSANQRAGLAVTPDGAHLYVAGFESAQSVTSFATDGMVASTTPLAGRAGGVAVNPKGDRVYVLTQDPDSVVSIDTVNQKTIVHPAQATQNDVVVDPSGAYVYVGGASPLDAIEVIDTATDTYYSRAVRACADELAISPDGLLYAAYSGSSSMSIVNPVSRQVVGESIPIESGALAVVADPARDRVYTANENGTICLVDTTKNTATKLPISWSR